MKKSGDKEVKALFERLRVADRAQAPSFRETLEGRPRESRSGLPGYGLAKLAGATAMLGLISAVLLLWSGNTAGPPAIRAASAMSEWVSPTESLLRSPAQELLSGRIDWIAVPTLTPDAGPVATRNPLSEEKQK